MIGTTRLPNLADLVRRALDDRVPGDFIETGVWRGGACILIRGLLAAYGDPGRARSIHGAIEACRRAVHDFRDRRCIAKAIVEVDL
jgi:hypothetical protein